MATEREAKQAASEHANMLRKLGAHSLGTTDGRALGLKGYAVVANVAPGFTGKLPTEISCTIDKGRVSVPLIARELEPFKPEKL